MSIAAGTEHEVIRDVLGKIFETGKNTRLSPALLAGTAGVSLFHFLYHQHITKTTSDPDFNEELQTIAEQGLRLQRPVWSTGKAGLNWYYDFLYLHKIIDAEDSTMLCDDKEQLKELVIQMLEQGNYDFLHGAVGIAWSMLYLEPEKHRPFFAQVFRALENILEKSKRTGMFPAIRFDRQQTDDQQVNLGLSHGITSILKYCIECIKRNICIPQAVPLALKIINFLLRSLDNNNHAYYFPSVVDLRKERAPDGRLAWCYGDLGIGCILYQAGKIMADQKLAAFSLKVLKHTTKLRSREETHVHDAGFCHGSAGAAHIYNKMWHCTKDPVFKEAADFWIGKTLEFSLHKDGIAGYKTFDPLHNTYRNDHSLLEGTSGIGLVLLSYLTGDFSWDYCVMLNN